jgi:intracellular septation protein
MAEEERETGDTRTQSLVDFGPLVIFVIAYKFGDIYWATGSFMVTAPLALLYSWRRERRLRPMPVVTAVVVLVFGGMTIWLRDPRFIYIKPTIITSLTAVVLLGGLAMGRPLLKPLLGSAMELADEGWRTLSLRFAIFSLGLAGLNEIVWRRFTPESEHIWVWFKFLGIPGLTLLFLLTQAPMLKRFRIEGDSAS